MIRRLAFTAALSALSLTALANEVNPISVAAGLGRTDYRASCAQGWNCDHTGKSSGKLTLAYTFDVPRESMLVNALELTYSHGGTSKATQAATGTRVRTAFDAFGVSYKASYSLGALGFQGRLGAAATSADMQNGALSQSYSRFGFTYGVGVSYQLTRNLQANVNVDRLPIKYTATDKGGANLFTVGLNYQFE